MLKQRNLFLDYFRGVSIIIVVLGHAIQICYGAPTDPVHSVIQTFQMSLLFVISGFSSGFSEPVKDFKKYFWAKVKRILFPYLVWLELNFLLVSLLQSKYSIVSQLKNLLLSQFWFLRILFLMFVVYGVFVLVYRGIKVIKNCILKASAATLAAGILTFLLSRVPGCESILNYIPFFVFGNVLYKLANIFTAKKYLAIFYGATTALAVMFPVSIFLLFRTEGLLQMLIDKSLAFSGIAFCYIVCRLIYAVPWLKKLSAMVEGIGANTLPIYAIHWCIFFNIPLPLYKLMVAGIGLYPSAFVVAVLWVILCLFLIFLFRKTKLTRVFLLGEK